MKLTYHQAVVSFCHDLTDAAAKSTPLGVLLVGRTDSGEFMAAAVTIPTTHLHIDEISRQVLGDISLLLKSHINAAFNRHEPGEPLVGILSELHGMLRNSLHVSRIEEEGELKADSPKKLIRRVHDAMFDVLEKDIGDSRTVSTSSWWPEEQKPRADSQEQSREVFA